MPTFEGEDPEDWLFRVEIYFDIHQLTDSKKITVTAVSFAGAALHWYRWTEGREPFTCWGNLKNRMLERFCPSQEGSLCARFLAVRQEGTVAEFRKQFETLAVPLPHLAEEVLESTFLNGLSPEVRSEVRCFGPEGLEAIMKTTQRIEDKLHALSYSAGPSPSRGNRQKIRTQSRRLRFLVPRPLNEGRSPTADGL